jgi:hypothetical protein
MQMITILKQNTSLQSIKYLYPIKCIHKTWTNKQKSLGGPHVYTKHLRGPIKQTVKNNSWLILWYSLNCSIQIHIKYLFDGKDFQFNKYVLSIFSELFFNFRGRKVCPLWTLKRDLWLVHQWALGH